MEIVWEDPPIPDGPFFTRDAYDKYSLAPSIRELWESLQSPEKSTEPSVEPSVEPKDGAPCKKKKKKKKKKKLKDVLMIESSGDEESVVAEAPGPDTAAGEAEKTKEEEADAPPFPEPRLPYPCFSSLSPKEQKIYLQYLLNKKSKVPFQNLLARVHGEVMQFSRYLQDVAKACADDYNFITPGAMKYSEELLSRRLEHVMSLPRFYRINEMTSLTGGTFNRTLALSFEKQLLIMGRVDITDHKVAAADAQLASDYPSVSSENPPAKKAKDMHAAISSDSNAGMLCSRYEPHVCLTRDALVALLHNHSPEFAERWELPVVVKTNSAKGSLRQKTVYVDSPLPPPGVTVRERSRLFHEESLKLSIKRNGSQNVFSVMTELPHDEKQKEESSQRNVVSFEDEALDFDVDLSDLETFGDTTFKAVKSQKNHVSSVDPATPKLASVTSRSSQPVGQRPSHDLELHPPDHESVTGDKPRRPEAGKENPGPGLKSNSESNDEQMETSEDERLVIDEPCSRAAAPATDAAPAGVSAAAKSSSSSSPSPQSAAKARRPRKRARVPGDQLSQILQMQSDMFSAEAAGSSALTQEATATPKRVESTFHPVSLVKPCVTSYLERSKSDDSPDVPSAPPTPSRHQEPKKILSEELQAGAEDEQDYTAPEQGNLIYKLYSLGDLLLMVRSSVSLAHTRRVASTGANQLVPVHVLPKLEYQLSYGVESLSRAEACGLWAEAALHSSTVSYVAHIDARTSRLALLRKLPDDWAQNLSCGFVPPKSLNILHHLLKKLARLEEGSYLVLHKPGEPFVSILKAADRGGRGEYDLQQVHVGAPQSSAPGLVPWIPVDPAVVLPFHQAHQRVPCTFPPQTVNSAAAPPANLPARPPQRKFTPGAPKGKQGRAARRKKFIQKLVQQSV